MKVEFLGAGRIGSLHAGVLAARLEQYVVVEPEVGEEAYR